MSKYSLTQLDDFYRGKHLAFFRADSHEDGHVAMINGALYVDKNELQGYSDFQDRWGTAGVAADMLGRGGDLEYCLTNYEGTEIYPELKEDEPITLYLKITLKDKHDEVDFIANATKHPAITAVRTMYDAAQVVQDDRSPTLLSYISDYITEESQRGNRHAWTRDILRNAVEAYVGGAR